MVRVRDIVSRTGLHKATVSRLLGTLVAAGFAEQGSQRRYSSAVQLMRKRRTKIGYASQSEDAPFAHEVTASIRCAAVDAGIELVFMDNRFSAKVALKNAARNGAGKGDLVIEFQTFDSAAPGATYFGGNNYEAGIMAGRALGH